MSVYIAVHGGAGSHSPGSERAVKDALRRACRMTMELGGNPSDGLGATSLVTEAIRVLEDDPCLNAGYGSNLTLDGTVECDASVMEGSSSFGAVGAVSGIKNPIKLARQVLEYSKRNDPIGRIAPLTLVSAGARSFASTQTGEHEHDAVLLLSPELLIAPKANESWERWKTRLESHEPADFADALMDDMTAGIMQDTVGGVAWHPLGGIAAGVSSGGLLLKLPGRIGEAAMFGAGCWAQETTAEVSVKRYMSCSVSGAGEDIIRASLARRIGQLYFRDASDGGRTEEDPDPHVILQRVLTEDFWKPARIRGGVRPAVGVLMLTVEEREGQSPTARLWCAFTTPSMAIGYIPSGRKEPKAVVLRQSADVSAEIPIFITAIVL